MSDFDTYAADEMAIMSALVQAHRDGLGLPDGPSPLEVARHAVRRIGRVAGVLWRFGKAHTPRWLLPVLAVCRIGFRAARILATSRELPWALRALFVIGCIQIPVLPFDEIALAIALGWLAIFHRQTLRDAITAAREMAAR